ncbi:cytochrome P450 [Streptomyces xanthochromogenes]|uniref:cytochrome P450 n=1 Tax=Streptomyces TaxID=1883 RepID=UPI00136DC6CC|nr:cytochrome P450 [Streptomyces sp. SID1034]MYV89705.1 cytochrome P450 [Streptomyces sp. SID1034]
MDPTPFRPAERDFIANPYPAYAELRAGGRIHHYPPTGQWLIPHHADVRTLLRDRRLGRTYQHRFTHAEFGRTPPPPAHEPFHTLNDGGMLDLEPPDHTRIRRLVSQAFNPRTVERLAPTVRRLAARLVDDFRAAGGGDLVAEVAEPLPVAVIAEILGIPDADRHLLRPWSAAICGMYELDPGEETAARAVRASVEFTAYLRELIAERRKKPGRDDLISALIAAHDEEGEEGEEGDEGGGTSPRRLTEQEMISTCVLLLNAGHEATVNTTANGWYALLRNPAQLAALRAAPEALLPTAIEELMRYDTPLQLFERWVLEDIEFAGQTLPRGSEVALLFGSANRDPARFADPDALDLTRADNPHISFGAGIHYCLGAPLARLELHASFGELLGKMPGLRLAAEPEWGPGFVIRGLKELRVEC